MNDEIIIHLLMYLQNMIDSGQHKLFYNDLMHDEKVIDIINAITNLQEENEDLKDRLKVMEHFKNSLLEENKDYKSRCEKAIEYIKGFENKFKGYAVFLDKRFLDLEELLSILNGGDEDEKNINE